MKYTINPKSKHMRYEVVIPVYKFKNQYREETVLVGSNYYGLTHYVVKSTGYSTLRYEDLQNKFKALRDVTEEEFLKPINHGVELTK